MSDSLLDKPDANDTVPVKVGTIRRLQWILVRLGRVLADRPHEAIILDASPSAMSGKGMGDFAELYQTIGNLAEVTAPLLYRIETAKPGTVIEWQAEALPGKIDGPCESGLIVAIVSVRRKLWVRDGYDRDSVIRFDQVRSLDGR